MEKIYIYVVFNEANYPVATFLSHSLAIMLCEQNSGFYFNAYPFKNKIYKRSKIQIKKDI